MRNKKFKFYKLTNVQQMIYKDDPSKLSVKVNEYMLVAMYIL